MPRRKRLVTVQAFNKRFGEHPFVELLLKNTTDQKIVAAISKKEALNEVQSYIRRVSMRVFTIRSRMELVLASLEFSQSYSASKAWKKRFDRGTYLRYHSETFFSTAAGILDRFYLLLNSVYDLGLDQRDSSKVLTNLHLVNQPVLKTVEKFRDYLNASKIRHTRNVAIHDSEFSDDELVRIEMAELIAKSDGEVTFKDVDPKKFVADLHHEYRTEKGLAYERMTAEIIEHSFRILDEMKRPYVERIASKTILTKEVERLLALLAAQKRPPPPPTP